MKRGKENSRERVQRATRERKEVMLQQMIDARDAFQS